MTEVALKRVARAVTMKARTVAGCIGPADVSEVADDFSKNEDHEAAAISFDLAADAMKAAEVPNIEKIQRWRRAAERERGNAKAGW